MGHAMLVNPQASVTPMIAGERSAIQLQQFSLNSPFLQVSFRFHPLAIAVYGPSSLMPAKSLSICFASQRSATSTSNRDKKDSKRKIKGDRPDLIEDDIYTIDNGWTVDISTTEEVTEVAGVQIPLRLKQYLHQNKHRTRPVVEKAPAEPARSTHKLLRVMGGRSAGKKLSSPADAKVRPMMEVVRGAVFSILKSLGNWNASSPSGRWLDLYSGTGSVAIEALSRGCCAEAHFVEMDPWVISNVLQPNLRDTKVQDQSIVHTSKVETLLQKVLDYGAQSLGGAFDYVSVTPPYEAVSYTQLMTQLSESPLLGDNTFLVVEYPLKSKHEMPDSCGALGKIRDRRYGRTNVAIYGPQYLVKDD